MGQKGPLAIEMKATTHALANYTQLRSFPLIWYDDYDVDFVLISIQQTKKVSKSR